jgi:hypothetical protein
MPDIEWLEMLPKVRTNQPNVLLIAFIRTWIVVVGSQNRNILSLLISGILILAVGSAIAQEAHHPPQDQAIHERFYSTWMMPDNRTMSCCHNKDCSPAESKFENGHWLARKVGDDGDWIAVPPQKIEHDRENPDGRSHLCSRSVWINNRGDQQLVVFCFISGTGS